MVGSEQYLSLALEGYHLEVGVWLYALIACVEDDLEYTLSGNGTDLYALAIDGGIAPVLVRIIVNDESP